MYEIKIKIHEEEDLYNPLDPEQETLSDDVVDYIIRKYQERDQVDKCCLHIISDKPVNEDRVGRIFREYLEHEQDIENKELRAGTYRQIRLLIIGVVFIGLWLMAGGLTDHILIEVLSIIGSFAIWEAANIFISEKPRIRMRKRRLKVLATYDIIFSVEE